MDRKEQRWLHALRASERIFVAGAHGFPIRLAKELTSVAEVLRGRSVTWPFVSGFGHRLPPIEEGRLEVFFRGKGLDGRADVSFTPMQYRRMWEWLAGSEFDLAMVRVVRGGDGRLHYGMGVDFQPIGMARARAVVLEVAQNEPFVPDAPQIDPAVLEKVVAEVEAEPRSLIGDSPPGESARAIAGHLASLVRDGDCLQMGIGSIPDAVMDALVEHNDLGCHSGMIGPGIGRLARKGVLTNARKSIDRGITVTGFVYGDRSFEQWAAVEGAVALRPVNYTHDAGVLAQIDDLVTINSAIEVDLNGQVNAEMIGGRQVSGTGGSVDFARGAALSVGGRSIVALPATARGGTVSRIVPMLSAGSCATLLRTDVDWVVTEHGAARLSGRSTEERVEQLIEVAAPAFRDELDAACRASR